MSSPAATGPASDRVRLRRAHQKGRHDRETIDSILDTTMLCHMGYVIDGYPAVTPTLQWRDGDRVYWHGSSASRMLRAVRDKPVCMAVTNMDGVVLARSGLHSSVNQRSVMLFGTATMVEGDEAKLAGMRAFFETWFPGRWDTLRPVQDQEVKATSIFSIPIEEASAKVRSGQPADDEEDYALPIWAGVIPMKTVFGDPEPDPRNLPEMDAVPPDVTTFLARMRGDP